MRAPRHWIALLAASGLFVLLAAVCNLMLPGALSVEAVVQLDHSDRLQVFYSAGGAFSERQSACSKTIAPDQQQTVHISLRHNAPMRRLRLDLGEHPGTVRLCKLTVAAAFSADRVLLPAEILQLFSRRSPGTSVRMAEGCVEAQTGDDPWIACDQPLLRPQLLPVYGLPLLFALLLFAALQQRDIGSLAPFADLRGRRPSSGEHIRSLDGLRAIAVLMVVADHTWGRFTGMGTSGVWIFMALSGFLLAAPFVQEPGRAVSLSYLQGFLLRRLRRILPAYYACVSILYLFNALFEEALLHFLFLKGSGHLWVVPQEMFFYLLTPPVMLLSCGLLRGRPLLVIPALAALMLAANRWLNANVIALHGMNNIWLRPYVGVFLAGMTASWVYHGLWRQAAPGLRAKAEPWAAALAAGLLLVFVLGSEEHLYGGRRIFTQIYFPWFGAAAAVLILAVLAAGERLRLLGALPLRALSLVSFSLYLFHPMILDLIRKAAMQCWGINVSGFTLFVSTLLFSYLFACLSYTLIERPFLRSA